MNGSGAICYRASKGYHNAEESMQACACGDFLDNQETKIDEQKNTSQNLDILCTHRSDTPRVICNVAPDV